MYLRALSHWQLGQVTERLGQSLSTTDSASNSFVESIKHTFRQLSVDASHSVASAPRTATTLTVLQAGLERDSTMDSAQQHCPRPGENEAATWARTDMTFSNYRILWHKYSTEARVLIWYYWYFIMPTIQIGCKFCLQLSSHTYIRTDFFVETKWNQRGLNQHVTLCYLECNMKPSPHWNYNSMSSLTFRVQVTLKCSLCVQYTHIYSPGCWVEARHILDIWCQRLWD